MKHRWSLVILIVAALICMRFFSFGAPDEATSAKVVVKVSSSGTPLQGAVVVFIRREGGKSNPQSQDGKQESKKGGQAAPIGYKGETDASGMLEIDKVAFGDYDVTCEKTGYAPALQHVTVTGSLAVGLSFTLTFGSGFTSEAITLGPVDPKTSRIFVALATEDVTGVAQSEKSPLDLETGMDLNDLGAIAYGGSPMKTDNESVHSLLNGTGLTSVLIQNDISLIDEVTRKVVLVIPTHAPPTWMLYSPRGGQFWLADTAGNITTYSDTGYVLGSVNVGNYIVTDMAVDGQGGSLYLAAKGLPDSAVFVLDGKTGVIRQNINIDEKYGLPGGVAVTPNGATLLVTSTQGNKGLLLVLDPNSGQVVSKYNVGLQPMGVGVTPDGTKAIVANYGSTSVDIVNLSSGEKTHLPGGLNPTRVLVRSDGKVAFVTNNGDDTVSVFNLETNQPIVTIHVGKGPMGITQSLDGKTVLVANHDTGNITFIDGYSFAMISMTQADPNKHAFGVAIRP